MRLDPKTVRAPEIGPIWLNSPPLTLWQLRGEVVLIDFWDFTCVNCIRTLPYVRGWHERYGAKGLQVLGIHSPEFYFGQAPEILQQGLTEFGIEYPVMLDNEYAAWKAFANRYWPSKYLIDADGYMRYFHAGEGGYAETEETIQELLRQRDSRVSLPPLMAPMRAMDEPGVLAACPRPTPELYLGHKRGRVANAGGLVADQVQRYSLGAGPQEDLVELGGRWNSLPDCLAVGSSEASDPSKICLFYSAAEVNLVLSPSMESPDGRLEIRENGAPLAPEARGADVVEAGGRTFMAVNRPRMYSIVRRRTFTNALLEISSASAGLQCFAFTFVSCPEVAA